MIRLAGSPGISVYTFPNTHHRQTLPQTCSLFMNHDVCFFEEGLLCIWPSLLVALQGRNSEHDVSEAKVLA